MHILLVTVGGLLLLGVFLLFGRLRGGGGVIASARLFILVWLVVALLNMWAGVTMAGYTLAQELPILVVVFAVPAAIAELVAWRSARGRAL
jgi:hypothetical protein